MEKMRLYCILNKKDYALGVLTNFKEWIFVKYSIKTEILDSFDRHQKCEESQFEMSDQIDLIKIDEVNNKIEFNQDENRPSGLCNIYHIIEHLDTRLSAMK